MQSPQKFPGQIVTGQTARAYALAAGDPNWASVTEFVIPQEEFDRLLAELEEPEHVIDPLYRLAQAI